MHLYIRHPSGYIFQAKDPDVEFYLVHGRAREFFEDRTSMRSNAPALAQARLLQSPNRDDKIILIYDPMTRHYSVASLLEGMHDQDLLAGPCALDERALGQSQR